MTALTEQEVLGVVTTAALAPSLHNSQPWRFAATEVGLDVWADRTRWLPVIDPSMRQLHVSCGAAAGLARLAVRGLGRECLLQLLPSGDADLLVRLHVLGQHPPTGHEARLLAAAPRRHTVRGPYDDRAVPSAVLAEVQQVVGGRGCWVRRVERPGERALLAALLARAQAAEERDPEVRRELARWRSADAQPGSGVSMSVYDDWTGGVVADVPLRDFAGDGGPARGAAPLAPRVERDVLLVLGTECDEPIDWLRAGRALAELLLTLTAHGVVAQPLGPVVDLDVTRQQLRHELGVIGFPQIALRVGPGTGEPGAGRLPVTDVLASAHAPRR
jgi:hypothetical protein